MIVLDASALLEILKQSDIGLELADLLRGRDLHAPHLIDLEIAQALRRLTFAGEINSGQAQAMLDAFMRMPLTRHIHTPLLPEIWSFRQNLTSYDACYLALARSFRAELLTLDEGLRKVAGRRPKPH